MQKTQIGSWKCSGEGFMWKKGSRERWWGKVPGRLMLEEQTLDVERQKIPHSPQQLLQLEPDQPQVIFPEEQGAHMGSSPVPLLLTPLPTPRVPGGLDQIHFQDSSLSPLGTNITAPAGWCLKFLLEETFSFHNWKMGVLKYKRLVKILDHLLKYNLSVNKCKWLLSDPVPFRQEES